MRTWTILLLLFVWVDPPAQAGFMKCIISLMQLRQEEPTSHQKINFAGQSVVVPLGVKASAFNSLVTDTFHELKDADVVVFYGSRTHFTYGYHPEPKSDLDIRVYFKPGTARSFPQNLATAFKEAAGVTLGAQFVPETNAILGDSNIREYTQFRSLKDERDFFNKTERSWLKPKPRDAVKAQVRERTGGISSDRISISKEAVILIRNSDRAENTLRQLQELGYTNVTVVDPP